MSYRLDRYELKFIITQEMRGRLLPELLPHLRPDANAGVGAHYPIVSLYYDNPDRDCYWENKSGVKSRRKLRVRLYGSLCGAVPPTCFAEVKHKVDGRNVKRRARLPLPDALAVAAGDDVAAPLSLSERRTVQEIQSLVRQRGYAPCCCMRYDRHAYVGVDPSVDLRITFDEGIAFRFDSLTPVPDDREFAQYLHDEECSVMEVKVTGAVPYWLTQLLGQTGCRPQSHSKYCRALEAGDPVLRRRLGERSVASVW